MLRGPHIFERGGADSGISRDLDFLFELYYLESEYGLRRQGLREERNCGASLTNDMMRRVPLREKRGAVHANDSGGGDGIGLDSPA